MKQFDDAEAALGRAVSYDFGIRASLRYHMINAELSEARGQYDKAIDILDELTKTAEYQQSTANEKVNLTLFMARCYQKSDKINDALKVVSDALTTWAETPDEDRIRLFHGSLLAGSGKIRDGIEILEAFPPTNPQYTKAQKTAAKIYLTKLNDKASYIRCFRQLVKVSPNKSNYILLGDAYRRVNRFQESVDSFFSAFQVDPRDKDISMRLARALFIVHNYTAALSAYVHAIEVSNNDPQAQLEYCRALVTLRRLDDARDWALESMQSLDTETGDWEVQSACAEFYELISHIDIKTGDPEQGAAELSDALLLYDRLTSPGRIDIPADSLAILKKRAAALHRRAAEAAIARDDRASAISALERALELEPGNAEILLAMGRVHLDAGHADKCRDVCQQLLRVDASCEDAALMLAEVSSSQSVEDLEVAFVRSPTFLRTLVRLIEKAARVGQLDRVPPLFAKCPSSHPGLQFCRGLYALHSGAPDRALEFLGKCRQDPEWGPQAQRLIFLIYANPQRKYVWSETQPLASAHDLEAAQKFLARLDGPDHRQLQALLLLAQNTDESVASALAIYEASDDDDVSAILGRCKCYLRLGRQRDATRNLNGIIHGEPSHSKYAVFVEAFLMMAHISVKDNQLDEAEKYVQRAIEIDQGSAKAWEIRGGLAERKKDYLAAADAFRKAWELSGNTDLAVGYKLAVCYMRGEDPVDAIKIARVIFEKHPGYPKLKETVFLPCCAALRP
jgi:tetratricopeptide repeat protein 21B